MAGVRDIRDGLILDGMAPWHNKGHGPNFKLALDLSPTPYNPVACGNQKTGFLSSAAGHLRIGSFKVCKGYYTGYV